MSDHLTTYISAKTPDTRIAIIFENSNGSVEKWTYGDVRAYVDDMAAKLARIDVAHKTVALLADNRPEYIPLCLAVMKAGGAVCPINWKLPQSTINAIFDDADIALALHDDIHANKCPPGARTMSISDLSALETDNATPPAAHTDTAFIMYTSGSTGMPKGVPISHRGYIWSLSQFSSAAREIEQSRTLICAPFYHMNAQCELLMALFHGGTCVVQPRFDVDTFLSSIERNHVTSISGVPSMMAMALNRLDTGFAPDLSSVADISIGSAPLSENLLQRISERIPQAIIDNGYGTTETGFITFTDHPDPAVPRPALSVGYPHPHIEWKLEGPEAPNKGVLWLKTGMMPKGYLNRPEINARKFVDGWYCTGDIMRRDKQGFFYFVEREDDMFVCGGINIYPGEIEKLLETHPDVQQAAVVPQDHDLKGQVPVAFVVLATGSQLSIDDLKSYALESGPAYAHPRRVIFLEALPLAGTNKIDKARLKSMLTERE